MSNVFGNLYHSSANAPNASFIPNSRSFGASSPNRGNGAVGLIAMNESLLSQQQQQHQPLAAQRTSALDSSSNSTNGLNVAAPEFDFDRFVNSNRYRQF